MVINHLFKHQSAAINAIRMYPEIPYVFLIGGFGCNTGGSLLSTPDGDVPIKDFKGGLVNTPLGPRIASEPVPVTTQAFLLEVDGYQTHCCGDHRVVDQNGNYLSLGEISARLLASLIFSIPLRTTGELSHEALLEDVQNWTRRVRDSLTCYLSCYHLDDAQLLSLEEAYQDEIPSQEYVQEHSDVSFSDDSILLGCIHLSRELRQLEGILQFDETCQKESLVWNNVSPDEHSSCVDVPSSCAHHSSTHHSKGLEDHLVSALLFLSCSTWQKRIFSIAQALKLSPCSTGLFQPALSGLESICLKAYNTSVFDTYIITQDRSQINRKVLSITPCGKDTVYRFQVDEAQCYYADGILSHNCGKSFTDVQLLLYLYHAYRDSEVPISIGIFGVTIKLLKQTVIADLERAFDAGGIVYKDNSQAGTITVGPITFVYLAMNNPDDIYAFNFNCAVCDEIDEVNSERVMPIIKAIQERCRVTMPRGHDFPERQPFIFFSTTAQGLGGTYMLIEQLKKGGVPYIKIRGRTQDNTSLAPQQIQLLRSLYTEDEAKAYLDGEFINLSTGRVYPCFDRKRHLYATFPVRKDDVLYVGQDFNAGYNAASVVIERAGRLFVVATYHWDFMGDAPRRLREIYPENKIILIPDASGKEIMSGFMEQVERAGIDVFWNNVNPSILERVTAINKLFMFNQLFVFASCDKTILCMETRDFDDQGKPRKGKGPDALDHWGDSLEYSVWHILHTVKGYDKILQAVHHKLI